MTHCRADTFGPGIVGTQSLLKAMLFWSKHARKSTCCFWVVFVARNAHNAQWVYGQSQSSSGHSNVVAGQPLMFGWPARIAGCSVKSTAAGIPGAAYTTSSVLPNSLQKGQLAPKV